MRKIESLGYRLEDATIADVRDVLDSLKCSICQDTAVEPRVIKHCLHFFCKECIEPYLLRMPIQQQKSCPLCKAELKTKRELRGYEKIARILAVLRPAIARADEQDYTQNEEIRQRQQAELKELANLRQQQQKN